MNACICKSRFCNHRRPMFGNTCHPWPYADAPTINPESHMCTGCHNAHNTTVKYHTADWDVLVSIGWTTVSVNSDGIATMIRED